MEFAFNNGKPYGLNEEPQAIPVTPADTMFWVAFYTDGSCDIECKKGEGPLFPDLSFKDIEHFTMLPRRGAPYNVAICVKKAPGYRLIWRKQRHVTTVGQYLGSDYMLGLEPDDKTNPLMDQIEQGKTDVWRVKDNPDGFRIWLLKDGRIATAGAFKKTEEMQEYDGEPIRYITCEVN